MAPLLLDGLEQLAGFSGGLAVIGRDALDDLVYRERLMVEAVVDEAARRLVVCGHRVGGLAGLLEDVSGLEVYLRVIGFELFQGIERCEGLGPFLLEHWP